MHPRIYVTNIFVDDQDKALAFYSGKPGFVPKTDIPVGAHRRLTVVGADAPDGVDLLLEPDENPATQAFKKALAEQGIPAASFAVDDVEEAYRVLRADGVTFVQTPTPIGPVVGDVLDDTCGNLIQIVSPA